MPFSGVLNLFLHLSLPHGFYRSIPTNTGGLTKMYIRLLEFLKGGSEVCVRQRDGERLVKEFYSVSKSLSTQFLLPCVGNPTQAHKWIHMTYTINSFCLSRCLWFSFSHTGGDDVRTWEQSLSQLRRSCLCLVCCWCFFLFVSFFLFVFLVMM